MHGSSLGRLERGGALARKAALTLTVHQRRLLFFVFCPSLLFFAPGFVLGPHLTTPACSRTNKFLQYPIWTDDHPGTNTFLPAIFSLTYRNTVQPPITTHIDWWIIYLDPTFWTDLDIPNQTPPNPTLNSAIESSRRALSDPQPPIPYMGIRSSVNIVVPSCLVPKKSGCRCVVVYCHR